MKITKTGILNLRKKLGLSQGAFGALLGVSQASVSKYESGDKNPRKSVAILIGNLKKEQMKKNNLRVA